MPLLDDKINEIQDKMALRARLKEQIKETSKALQFAHAVEKKLKKKIEDELKDIYNVGNVTFKGVLHMLMKTRENQLEKERLEHLQATINYEKKKKQKVAFKFQLKVLKEKYNKLSGLDEELQKLILKKEDIIFEEDKDLRLLINEFRIRRKHIEINIKDIEEVQLVGKHALEIYEKLLSDIKHVKEWGGRVYIGVGRQASLKKKRLIEESYDKVLQANVMTETFLKEGSDLDPDFEKKYKLETHYYEDFINVFISHLVHDFLVKDKLNRALAYLEEHNKKISNYLDGLNEGMKSLENRKRRVEKERKALILSSKIKKEPPSGNQVTD